MNLGCLKAHMDDEICTPWLELIVPCFIIFHMPPISFLAFYHQAQMKERVLIITQGAQHSSAIVFLPQFFFNWVEEIFVFSSGNSTNLEKKKSPNFLYHKIGCKKPLPSPSQPRHGSMHLSISSTPWFSCCTRLQCPLPYLEFFFSKKDSRKETREGNQIIFLEYSPIYDFFT